MTWLEVAPNIFSIREKSYRFSQPSVNVYFVLCDNGHGILYDAGYAMKLSFNDFLTNFTRLVQQLKLEGRLRKEVAFHDIVDRIIVSHEHHDHSSGVPLLRRYFPRAIVCASAATAALLKHQSDFVLMQQRGFPMLKEMIKDMLMNFFLRLIRVQPSIKIDHVLKDGEEVAGGEYNFRVLLVTGHSPSQALLHDEQHRMLFTSDLILQDISTWLGPPHSSYRGYMEAMERLAALDLSIMLPAHGKMIMHPRERTMQLIKFRQLREEQIVKTCAEKSQSIGDIAWRTYRERGLGIYMISRGLVNLVADYLVENGRLRAIKAGRKIKYIKT
nr:MBL fold metallo-hydrolase [Candidatus Sigynarchaeota archaeon]